MSRTVCFIDKEDGMIGICVKEGFSQEELNKIFKDGIIDCEQCDFYKKFEGEEDKHFSYTFWQEHLKDKKGKTGG